MSKRNKESAPKVENWENFVISTDLNCVDRRRSCDVIFVAERIPKHTQYLVRFSYGASITPQSNVKCVTYSSLLEYILNAKNVSSSADDSHISQMFNYAAKQTPGNSISELEKSITPIGMSLFIKLQIMKIIEEDVWLEKNVILKAKISEAERLQETSISTSSKETKKGKEKAAKQSNKKSTVKEPCATENLLNASPNALKLCLDTIDVPYKHLIITLIGFLEPELFSQLFTNGVPVICLLEITSNGQDDMLNYFLLPQELTQYYTFTRKEESNTKVETSADNFTSISKIANTVQLTQDSSDEVNKLKESRSLKNKMSVSISFREFYNFSNFELEAPESFVKRTSNQSVLETPVHNDCFSLFKRFWDKAYELFQSDAQADYVENTFHMKYDPEREVFASTSDMNEFVNECFDIFEAVSSFLKAVPTTIRQYINYIKNMRLDRLSEQIQAISVEQLLTYKNMMRKVSPECFTIPLLLHCLVEEVHNRHESQFQTWQLDVQRESVLLDKHKEKAPLSLKMFLAKLSKPKLINVVTKRIGVLKMPQCSYENLELVTTVKSRNYDRECTNKIILMPFKIHENNCIEKAANFYRKSVSADLFNANINILSFLLPALLLKQRFTNLNDIKKLMDECNLQGWCQQLNLPLSKLIDVIHLLLFSTHIRKRSTLEIQQKATKVYDQRFPTKSITEQVQQEGVRIEGEETSKAISNGIHNEQSSLSSERDCKLDKVPKIPYIDLYGIKYSEKLKAAVLLQKLFSVQTQYPYIQYRYVPLTDSLLIYFYQSSNKYGTVTEVFNQSLPTPVCIRDFCRFVVHDIQEWLEKEEKEYLTVQEDNQDDRREDLICNVKLEEEVASVKGKQSEKGKKKEEIVIEPEVPPVAPTKVLLPQCASSDKPYAFYGYDLGSARVQLTGSSSTLYSKDGTTVIVDKTSWIGAEKTITIRIKLLHHLFIMHLPNNQCNDNDNTLRFHFSLSDDTIICFSKTRSLSNSMATLYERQCTYEYKTKKGHLSSAYKPPLKNVYCFSQEQDAPLNPLTIPFVTKEELVIPPSPIGCFLQYLQRLNENIISNFPYKLDELESEKSTVEEEMHYDEEEFLEETIGSNQNEINGIENEETVDLNPFELSDFSPDIKPTISSVMSNSTFASDQKMKKRKKYAVKNSMLRPSQRNKILKFLGIENQLKYPKFKIISSMLHRNEYIKRIKSSVTIPVGESTKKLLIKTTFPRARKVVKITKWYPTFLTDTTDDTKKHKFEFQSSMKSGLMIVTIPGFGDASIQIKQFYVDKGPACSIILDEEFRIFVDGMVIIKGRDGNYKILCADSSIVYFEMPHSQKHEKINLRPPISKDKYGKVKRFDYVPLGLKDKKTRREKRRLFKLICRKGKHLIDGPNRFLFQRQRKQLRKESKAFKGPLFYVEQNDVNDLLDFQIVTSTGVRIKAKLKEPIKKDAFLIGSEVDSKAEQIIFEREDGTHSILDSDGTFVTQFPDGTRIKARVICDENLVMYFPPEEKKELGRETTATNITHDSSENQEGWLFIVVNYEYEHPCYAKVFYNSYLYETTVEYPNKSRIRFDDTGVVFVTLGKGIDINMSEKSIDILTKPCPLCPCKSECNLDISPFYNEKLPLPGRTFLKMFDSHGKFFKVTYDGTCKTVIGKRNIDIEHCMHDFTELGKLFVVNRDLSGSKFWDSKLLLKFKMRSKDCTDHSVELHKKSMTNEINCIDFKSVVKKAYFEEFLRPYEYPYLRLKMYQPKSPSPNRMAYTTYRIINVIPASEKLAPFYGVIYKAVEKIDTEITDFRSLLNRLTDESLHTDLDNLIKLQMLLSSYDDVTDWDKNIEKKPKRRKRSRKNYDRQAETQVQLKIPFENEFILCETELAPDFRQALLSYNKWYSSLFRCKCKAPQKRISSKCFRKSASTPKLTSKHAEPAPCDAEINDYCKYYKTPPTDLQPIPIKKTCKKQQSVSIESVLPTVPCAVDPFLQDAKPDCTLLPKIENGSKTQKTITEKDGNVFVCQILKLNPLKDTGSATAMTPTEFLSGNNLDGTEKRSEKSIFESFGQGSRKFRMPFTIRSTGINNQFSRGVPTVNNIHGDFYDVNLPSTSNSSSDKFVNKYSAFGEGRKRDINHAEGSTNLKVLTEAVDTKKKTDIARTRGRSNADGFSFRNSKEMNIQQKRRGNELNLKTSSIHRYAQPVGLNTKDKKKSLNAKGSNENPTLSGNCLRRVSNTINLNTKTSRSFLKRESDTKVITAASQAKMIFSGTLYSKLATSGSTSSLKGNFQYSLNGHEKDKMYKSPGHGNKSFMKKFVAPDELKEIVSELSIFDRNHSKRNIRRNVTQK
ncbi:uncharacterized protein LOC108739715 [Agrilus planipennis]|uniref:Uncharacterized protein LOC108739715 n=1 Tax=Agrilus planipennis TaxID=224129 RepID=A0A1W4X8S7_AGRPL|nr:uncharacterized protein LOC108739715 [Agrilus planipennis]